MFDKKSMKKFVRELILEDQRTKDYLRTEDFQKQFGLIKRFQRIDQEDITYFPQKYARRGLTPENFQRVCESIFKNFEDNLEAVSDCSCAVDYQGVRFSLLVGQGSCYITNRL